MRLLFYKLPGEGQGENVLVTESYSYVDSELAILLDDADLDLDWYDIMCDNGTITVTLVPDDALPDISPYMNVESDIDFDATLPFKDETRAFQFAQNIQKWQEFLMKAYDE